MKQGDVFLIEDQNDQNKVSVIAIAGTNKAETRLIMHGISETITFTTERLKGLIISKIGHSRGKAYKQGDPVKLINSNRTVKSGVILTVIKNTNYAKVIVYNKDYKSSKERLIVERIDTRFLIYSTDILSTSLFRIKVNKKGLKFRSESFRRALGETADKILSSKSWPVESIDEEYIYSYFKSKTAGKITIMINPNSFISCIIPRLGKKEKILPKVGQTVIIKRNIKHRGALKGDTAQLLEAIYQKGENHLTSSKMVVKLSKNNRVITVLLKHLKPTVKKNIENAIQDTTKKQATVTQGNQVDPSHWTTTSIRTDWANSWLPETK